jgi:hypothetical protein
MEFQIPGLDVGRRYLQPSTPGAEVRMNKTEPGNLDPDIEGEAHPSIRSSGAFQEIIVCLTERTHIVSLEPES